MHAQNSMAGCFWKHQCSIWPIHPEDGPSAQQMPTDGNRASYLRLEVSST